MNGYGLRAPDRIGRYEVLCELGRGGMAELYLARLRGLGGFERLVAIKRILPQHASDRVFIDSFLNEGRLAARLSHPNVCQVYELGEDAGMLYLVMEYLEGATWEDLVPNLPADPAARLRLIATAIGQACDGLHHAHEQPIVHRDVSPNNLFVTVDGVTKVLDFGVSKLLTDGKHTRTGVVKGKLSYMSPEQIEGTGLDHRSDVWAAGVIVWEAITGEKLFSRTTDFQVWKAITEEPLPSLADPVLDRVVGRALTRDREQRYPTIAAFADALRALVGRELATSAELGALVRASCKDQIASRAALVTSAMQQVASHSQPPASATPAPLAGSSATNLGLRDHSLVIARRPRWPFAVLGLVAAGAIAGVISFATCRAARSTSRDAIAQATPPDATPVSPDAPVTPDAPGVVSVTPAEVPASKPAPSKPPTRSRPPPAKPPAKPSVPPEPAPSATAPGTFTVDSRPFARISIDGGYVGDTPLFRHRLAPGPHTVRAVLEDGRQKTFQIVVTSEREVNSGTLAW